MCATIFQLSIEPDKEILEHVLSDKMGQRMRWKHSHPPRIGSKASSITSFFKSRFLLINHKRRGINKLFQVARSVRLCFISFFMVHHKFINFVFPSAISYTRSFEKFETDSRVTAISCNQWCEARISNESNFSWNMRSSRRCWALITNAKKYFCINH